MEKKIVVKMADLEAYCQEFKCRKCEAVTDILLMFYEAAGFWTDALEAELGSMSDEKLMETYLCLYE